MEILLAVSLGFVLDLMIGDPHGWPHPICLIGNFIAKGEKIIRKQFPKTKKGEILGGGILNILVLTCCYLVPFFILIVANKVHPYLRIAIETIFCYQIFATKSLKTESMKVHGGLALNDILKARKYLSYIVGRDTENLDEEAIAKAVVETVAENTTDGVIAPMIFMLIGGAPLGFLYKGVNTLDSMVGYKNEKHINFGKISAKVDDVFNFIPAIITAWLMILSAFLLRLNYKNAWKIYRRDRYNHASPNSAKTESVSAGALEIQLAGDSYYFGTLYKKKTIGDPIRKIQYNDIKVANKLMYATSITGMVILGATKLLEVLI